MLYSLMCTRQATNVRSGTGERYDVNQTFCFNYPNAPKDDAEAYRKLYNLFGLSFGYNWTGEDETRNNTNFTSVDDGMIDDTPDRDLYASFMFTIEYVGRYRAANSPLQFQINLPNQLIVEVVPALTNKLREAWDATTTTPLYAQNPPKPPFSECDDDFVVINCVAVIGG